MIGLKGLSLFVVVCFPSAFRRICVVSASLSPTVFLPLVANHFGLRKLDTVATTSLL